MKKIGWFGVVMGHSKVVGNVTIRWSAHDFLFNFIITETICLSYAVSEIWRVIGRKSLIFTYHTCIFGAFIVVEPVVISPISFFLYPVALFA